MDLAFDKEFIEEYKNIKNRKTFYLIKSEDKYFEKLKDFLESLKKVFPWIDYEVKEGNRPYIEFDSFSFYGMPYGHLLNYFIKIAALHQTSVFSNEFEQKFFVSSMCPNCPVSFDNMIGFLKKKTVKTSFYFCDDNYGLASEYEVMSVPCLLIEKNGNEIQRLVGRLNIEDLDTVFGEKDTNELTQDYFTNIIEQGRASDIADMMISENRVFSGFLSLFQSSGLGLRVGAAVTAEILAEKSPLLFEDLIDRLYEIYFEVPVEIKGDILYLFSLSEQKNKWIKEIEKIEKTETNEILKEIIEDSLDTLNQ
ncbi:MAG: thioredoxin family protein [Desulfobacteraceae bacterium]|nr:thioredoxin family protein [Desulfobacteraceae bacterium]